MDDGTKVACVPEKLLWVGLHLYSYGVLGSKKLCILGAKCREGIKSEHVHVFESGANAHTQVILLGLTLSRDLWVVERCAVGEGERCMERSALHFSIFSSFLGLHRPTGYVASVALYWCHQSVNVFASRASTYTHRAPKSHHMDITCGCKH